MGTQGVKLFVIYFSSRFYVGWYGFGYKLRTDLDLTDLCKRTLSAGADGCLVAESVIAIRFIPVLVVSVLCITWF